MTRSGGASWECRSRRVGVHRRRIRPRCRRARTAVPPTSPPGSRAAAPVRSASIQRPRSSRPARAHAGCDRNRVPARRGDAGETVPLPDDAFDLALSEYGAVALGRSAERWVPEAARLLRPGGRLIFMTNSNVSQLLCAGRDGAARHNAAPSAAFGLFRRSSGRATTASSSTCRTARWIDAPARERLRRRGAPIEVQAPAGRDDAPGLLRLRHRRRGRGSGPPRRFGSHASP